MQLPLLKRKKVNLMNNLKEQILNLFQNWYDEYAFDTWHTYKEEIRRLAELLGQIYNLTKNYEGEYK